MAFFDLRIAFQQSAFEPDTGCAGVDASIHQNTRIIFQRISKLKASPLPGEIKLVTKKSRDLSGFEAGKARGQAASAGWTIY
jgi:hypothetical protein